MWGAIAIVVISFLALCATLRPYAPQSVFKRNNQLRFFRGPR